MKRTDFISRDDPPWPGGLSTAAGEIVEGRAGAGAELTVPTLGRDAISTLGRNALANEGAITVVGCSLPKDGRFEALRLWGFQGR